MLVRPGSGFLGRLSHVLRPMMHGLPMVIALKCRMSSGMRQGMAPLFPITPFAARATTREIIAVIMLRAFLGARRQDGILSIPKQLWRQVLGRKQLKARSSRAPTIRSVRNPRRQPASRDEPAAPCRSQRRETPAGHKGPPDKFHVSPERW